MEGEKPAEAGVPGTRSQARHPSCQSALAGFFWKCHALGSESLSAERRQFSGIAVGRRVAKKA